MGPVDPVPGHQVIDMPRLERRSHCHCPQVYVLWVHIKVALVCTTWYGVCLVMVTSWPIETHLGLQQHIETCHGIQLRGYAPGLKAFLKISSQLGCKSWLWTLARGAWNCLFYDLGIAGMCRLALRPVSDLSQVLLWKYCRTLANGSEQAPILLIDIDFEVCSPTKVMKMKDCT